MRVLSCVFIQAGGKGSKQQPAQQTALLEPCLGVLLVDFFRMFGRVINMRDVGMASSDGGHFYRKVRVLCALCFVAALHCVCDARLFVF